MRFLTATVTPYPLPVYTNVSGSYPEGFAAANINSYSSTYQVNQAAINTTIFV